MALWQRHVPKIPVAEDVYEKKSKNILEYTGALKMVGLLRQLGSLSEYSADIFNTLFKESCITAQRIGGLSQRIDRVDHATPAIEKTLYTRPPREFYGGAKSGKAWRRKDEVTHSLFVRENEPGPIVEARNASAPPPAVHRLDAFFAGKEHMRSYSDPSFFLAEWLRAEDERQRVLMEETKQKRAQKKKPAEVKAAKGPKVIETIGAKVYNTTTGVVERTEVKQVTIEQPKQEDVVAAPAPPPPMGDDGPAFGDFGSAPAPPELPAYDPGSAPAPPMSPTNSPSPPSDSDTSSASPPPVPAYEIPTATAFVIPDIPAAPAFTIPDPPDLSAAPPAPDFDAPAMDDTPKSGGYLSNKAKKEEDSGTGENFVVPGGGSSTGLVAELQRGRALKKAAERKIEPKKEDARTGMLSEIRSRNFNLRHVKKEEDTSDKGKPATSGGGGLSSIMEILARRKAIENEDDEAGGDDDWAA